MDAPTRTESTEERYLKLAKRLIRDFERSAGHNWQDNPDNFYHWCLEQTPNWTKPTWRNYRASLAFYFDQDGYPSLSDMIKSIGQEDCLRKSDKGPAKKQKKLPKEEMIAIVEYLSKKNKPMRSHYDKSMVDYDAATSLWIMATWFTGLRPIEWKDAQLNGKKLIVRNAKNTNGRACGEFRTLDLSSFNSRHFDTVEKMVRLSKSQGDEFEKFYRNCAKVIYRAGKNLWPHRKKIPSLYSARHQFSANNKENGMTKVELAAVMGHVSDLTAGLHYAHKRQGEHGVTMIKAAQENIDLVRRNDDKKQLKKENRSQVN